MAQTRVNYSTDESYSRFDNTRSVQVGGAVSDIVVIHVRILFDESCNFVRFSIEHSSSNLESSDTKLKSQSLTGNDTTIGECWCGCNNIR